MAGLTVAGNCHLSRSKCGHGLIFAVMQFLATWAVLRGVRWGPTLRQPHKDIDQMTESDPSKAANCRLKRSSISCENAMTLRDRLREDFAITREKMEEKYPDLGAVETLKYLEDTVDDVPPELLAEYEAVFLRWETYEVVKLHDEALRAIGFRLHPVNAAEFVRQFIETANADRKRFETPRLTVV
jgi:hypothetical protein